MTLQDRLIDLVAVHPLWLAIIVGVIIGIPVAIASFWSGTRCWNDGYKFGFRAGYNAGHDTAANFNTPTSPASRPTIR